MTTYLVSATDLKHRLGEYVERASHGDRLRITRHGRTVAVIISAKDLELLQRLDRAKARPSDDALRDVTVG